MTIFITVISSYRFILYNITAVRSRFLRLVKCVCHCQTSNSKQTITRIITKFQISLKIINQQTEGIHGSVCRHTSSVFILDPQAKIKYKNINFLFSLQANPWDTNPPLGTTPNLVWPQNQNPFQHQGGAAPWPHYNQQSLYPPYMPPQGLPPCNTNNIRSDYYSPGSNTDSSITRSATSNHNNSNLNRSRNNMATCPCCGNMTTKETIQRGQYIQMIQTNVCV